MGADADVVSQTARQRALRVAAPFSVAHSQPHGVAARARLRSFAWSPELCGRSGRAGPPRLGPATATN
jgi:hypothetical protein